VPVAPPLAASDSLTGAFAGQRAREQRLETCMRDADKLLIADRRRARALAASRRSAAMSKANRRAAARDTACRRRHGRIPGRVDALRASSAGRGSVRLSFRSVGSNNTHAPAARGYLIKQSTRPIRTKLDFARAFALCGGLCSFEIDEVGASLTLNVTGLQPQRRYHYAIAARDNVVSALRGPSSRTISAVAG